MAEQDDSPQKASTWDTGDLVDQLENLFVRLRAEKPPEQRRLSLVLFRAALAVALHGIDQVSKELAHRATQWEAGHHRRYRQMTDEVETRDAIRQSGKPKTRGTSRVEGTAFEEAGSKKGISPITAERRMYRKRPRRR
jgi:hypothetical protein